MEINSGKIVNELVGYLKANQSFKDMDFVTAYENEIKPNPVLRPICAISVEECFISEKLTNTLPSGEIVKTDKRNMELLCSLDFYVPYSMGGNGGHMLFDRVMGFLACDKKYEIVTAKCNNAVYDKLCEAIVLHSQISLKYRLMP